MAQDRKFEERKQDGRCLRVTMATFASGVNTNLLMIAVMVNWCVYSLGIPGGCSQNTSDSLPFSSRQSRTVSHLVSVLGSKFVAQKDLQTHALPLGQFCAQQYWCRMNFKDFVLLEVAVPNHFQRFSSFSWPLFYLRKKEQNVGTYQEKEARAKLVIFLEMSTFWFVQKRPISPQQEKMERW